jgi:hypothetical protein
MTVITRLRPGPDEYAAALSDYVDGIGEHEDILAVLTGQLDRILAWLGAQPEERGDYRYAPGKWSIKEIVGHLCDTERVWAYRALRIGRGDTTPLPGFDDQSYVPEVRAGERTLASLASEWGDVRRATLSLFLNLPAAAWDRRGTASDSPISVRALAYIIAGHVGHHFEVLEERYTK